jgi:anti-sigma regulatory factor (Ser/Thr protein kinase)
VSKNKFEAAVVSRAKQVSMPLKGMNRITEETFEQLIEYFKRSPVIDLQGVTFIDPYGMVGLLEIGNALAGEADKKTLYLPKSEEVLKYLERMGFFKFAGQYFDPEPNRQSLPERYQRSWFSDVLLEITPIEKSDDIHFIVGKVKERAHAILTAHLHYDDRATNGFIVALSEVCQNIIEHSETTGFVGIQKYSFQRVGKNVVEIAVMDTGIGFKKSLSQRFSFGDDLTAIEKALLQGASRYTDEGRGHGLAALKRFVNEWNGKLSIRSGTAKASIIPEWAWGKERLKNLASFPGAQINILLPEI